MVQGTTRIERMCPAGGKFEVLGPTLYTRFLITFKIIIHICFQIHPLSLDVPKGLADLVATKTKYCKKGVGRS